MDTRATGNQLSFYFGPAGQNKFKFYRRNLMRTLFAISLVTFAPNRTFTDDQKGK